MNVCGALHGLYRVDDKLSNHHSRFSGGARVNGSIPANLFPLVQNSTNPPATNISAALPSFITPRWRRRQYGSDTIRLKVWQIVGLSAKLTLIREGRAG